MNICDPDLGNALEITVRPGRYVLEIQSKDLSPPICCMRVLNGAAEHRHLHMPVLANTIYVLRVYRDTISIRFSKSVISGVRVRPFGIQTFRHLIWMRRSDYKARLEVANLFSMTALLAANGEEGRELKKSLSILRKFGFALSSDNFQRTPGLFCKTGVSDQAVVAESADDLKIAIVLHLFYRDLWDEFETHLRKIKIRFHLIITISESDREFEKRVARSFPSSDVLVVENRGRDVGPFVELLRLGALDAFDLVCKLHGKRSGVSGPRVLLGHIWRRVNIADLIGSNFQIEMILNTFRQFENVGLVGSRRFHFPNEYFDEDNIAGANSKMVSMLASRLGHYSRGHKIRFFAGTMFWIRRQPLQLLKKLNLSIRDFPEESGAVDGELQHALERVFGILPEIAGMVSEDAPVVKANVNETHF